MVHRISFYQTNPFYICPECMAIPEHDRRKKERPEKPDEWLKMPILEGGTPKKNFTPEPPDPPPVKPAFDYEAWYERMPENLTLRVLQGDTVEVKLWIAEPALYKHEPYNSEDK